MTPLDLVNLTQLMRLTNGLPHVRVGLIDGPVAVSHPALKGQSIQEVPGPFAGSCSRAASSACAHGTYVAGILSARRSSLAPAICPDCSLFVRPIFPEVSTGSGRLPTATPVALAAAILDCIKAGALVVNLSLAMAQFSSSGGRALQEALDFAAKRGVLVVAAAGNGDLIGGSAITSHSWVIPVVACDARGRPIGLSNLGRSIAKRGLSAPGEGIYSLGSNGKPLALSGSSVAAPFVTGAIALLWSEFPRAQAAELKYALTGHGRRLHGLAPPLLDAWAAYRQIALRYGRGDT